MHEAIANRSFDFKSASLGPDAIVYEQFAGIHLYDLKTGAPVESAETQAKAA